MEDTIAAIATAQGEGGIGIVRVSGEHSLTILKRIFKPKYKNTPIENRRLCYGTIVNPEHGQNIDEVLVVYMKGPATYTTEDVIEINCHGSLVSLRNTLDLVLKSGARLAERGEFTKRAFLNGRIDLSQAEAVIDLIKAKTEKGYQVALSQMEGALSQRIKSLRESITDLLVDVTVNLDYPDEDIEELTYEALLQNLFSIKNELEHLLRTADCGRMIKEGIRVTIVGKPNVGKSSLMNALLRESRAIVTEIPGTTRDTIEEFLNIQGIPVRLTDTAGIRITEDKIERIGIEKSKESFNQADLILFMVDRSKRLTKEDEDIIDHLDGKNVIVLLNKSDVNKYVSKEEIAGLLPGAHIIETSVKQEWGIEALESCILDLVYGGTVKQDQDHSTLITNVRHKNLLEQAFSALDDAIGMTKKREALDFIEVDIKRAWEILGEMIGETVTDDIIDKVFERFCLGK